MLKVPHPPPSPPKTTNRRILNSALQPPARPPCLPACIGAPPQRGHTPCCRHRAAPCTSPPPPPTAPAHTHAPGSAVPSCTANLLVPVLWPLPAPAVHYNWGPPGFLLQQPPAPHAPSTSVRNHSPARPPPFSLVPPPCCAFAGPPCAPAQASGPNAAAGPSPPQPPHPVLGAHPAREPPLPPLPAWSSPVNFLVSVL